MTPARRTGHPRRDTRMDTGTPGLWRRRSIAAVGILGIAVAGGGFFFPGTAAADNANSVRWTAAQNGYTDTVWTVPAGVCAVDWTLQGGVGGNSGDGSGGWGGHVTARTPAEAGQNFTISPGQAAPARQSNGVAGGYSGSAQSGGAASGDAAPGGGASIVRAGTDVEGAPLLVAGGGGGAGLFAAG